MFAEVSNTTKMLKIVRFFHKTWLDVRYVKRVTLHPPLLFNISRAVGRTLNRTFLVQNLRRKKFGLKYSSLNLTIFVVQQTTSLGRLKKRVAYLVSEGFVVLEAINMDDIRQKIFDTKFSLYFPFDLNLLGYHTLCCLYARQEINSSSTKHL